VTTLLQIRELYRGRDVLGNGIGCKEGKREIEVEERDYYY
jgi:hypothetical protein